MVHQGITYATKYDLECLIKYVRAVLYKLIELKKNMNSIIKNN